MKYQLFGVIIIMTSFSISSQESVVAEKEHIASLNIGNLNTEAAYMSNEEGFYTPGSPEIDADGNIWLFSYTDSVKRINNKGQVFTETYSPDCPLQYRSSPNDWFGLSQQGQFGFSWHQYDLEQSLFRKSNAGNSDHFEPYHYAMPWGVAAQRSNDKQNVMIAITYDPVIFEMNQAVKRKYAGLNSQDTKAWLPTQPGGFSIGNDGLLYRNGILWSAVKPASSDYLLRYAGKLMSGHNIWVGGGMYNQEKYIQITDSRGIVELIMDVPWADSADYDPEIFRMFNYGIGPWGEIYYLIAPKEYLKPLPGDVAELVVVRNHLKYFGRLNDKDVRLRSEPGTGGKVLGTFPAKTGFRILERNGKTQTIGGKTSDWVRVRLLDGREGWFFGAFVHNLYEGPGLSPPWPNLPDW